jgi:hypothetical protein
MTTSQRTGAFAHKAQTTTVDEQPSPKFQGRNGSGDAALRSMLSPFETLHGGHTSFAVAMVPRLPCNAQRGPPPPARKKGYVWGADAADQSPRPHRLMRNGSGAWPSGVSTALLSPELSPEPKPPF